jgi:diguanylate cyclase (GGDEF)-like protein
MGQGGTLSIADDSAFRTPRVSWRLRQPRGGGRRPVAGGSEEFLIILPETDIEAGMQVAEKLRLAVAAQHDDGDGDEVSISVSLGIADHDMSYSLDNCLQRADRALYAAKTMVRNCCALAAR